MVRIRFKAINTWAVALLRYGAGIVNWKAGELRNMDRTTKVFDVVYI